MNASSRTSFDARRGPAAPFLFSALLLGACRAAPQARTVEPTQQETVDRPADAGPPRPGGSTAPLDVAPESPKPWWHATVDLRYPLRIGFAEFDFGDGDALDSVTAVSFIPTADVYLNLDRDWTLIPFLGLGGGWLIDDGSGILIASTGVRLLYEHRFGASTTVRVQPRLRYDVNMNQPDGLLGDLGQADLVLELRQALGDPEDSLVLEPGLYTQGFWFWDDIEFEVPGLTPESIEDQVEVGISLAPRDPVEVLGFELPRVYVGYRFGSQVEILEIRFGEL